MAEFDLFQEFLKILNTFKKWYTFFQKQLQLAPYNLREFLEVNLLQILGYLNFPGINMDVWYPFQDRTNPFNSVENRPITNWRLFKYLSWRFTSTNSSKLYHNRCPQH